MLTPIPSSTLRRALTKIPTNIGTVFADGLLERVRNLSAGLQLLIIAASSKAADTWADIIAPWMPLHNRVHVFRAIANLEGWAAHDR